MDKLPQLQNQLSNEWKKPKPDRNYDLIHTLQEDIQREKTLLHKEFKKSQKQKHSETVKLRLSLWKKKNDQYGKLKAESKKKKQESENQKREKIQQKKKVK